MRIWEVDFARGFLIITMVIYHFAFDLNFFSFMAVNLNSLLWNTIRLFTGGGFILVAGIGASLSSQKKVLRHGINIFFWAMIVTLVTYVFMPYFYVKFGVLHLIGLSLILSYPFIKRPKLAVLLSIPLILANYWFEPMIVSIPYLFIFNLKTLTFSSLDYYPLIPWFGVFLLGIGIGKAVYRRKKSLVKTDNKYAKKFSKIIGQNTLFIYLAHQPVMLAVLFGIRFVFTGHLGLPMPFL